MVEIFDAALEYAENFKWFIFPVSIDKTPLTEHGFKDASIDPEQIKAWWEKWPDAQIGVATGEMSGLIVLDIDKEGMEFFEKELIQNPQFTSSHIVARTGGNGLHFFYSFPKGKDIHCYAAFQGHIGIDLRANGGYAILAPSRNLSGPYEWIGHPYGELPDFPPLLYSSGNNNGNSNGHLKKFVINANPKLGIGQRHDGMVRRAGMLRAAGLNQEDIYLALQKVNLEVCDPPLEENEIKSISFSMNYPAVNTKVEAKNGENQPEPNQEEILNRLLTFELNDTGHSDALVFLHGDKLRYNCNSGRWLIWDNHYWKPDLAGYANNLVIDTYRRIKEAAHTLPDEEKEIKEKILKSASGTGNYNKIIATLKIAQSQNGVTTEAGEWDSNPMLFGVKNGIVDLSTGKLLNGEPKWLISKISEVEYVENAKAPRWEQFLKEIFNDNQDTVDFIQRAIGYSMTGHNSEQYMYMLIGRGANGKSTLLKVILELMGDYGIKTPFTTFEKRFGSSPASNDIASLEGSRFIMASESNEGLSLDEAKLKALTGGDAVSARYLYHENFIFKPVGKIFLGTNHKPRVSDDSYGFWRRVLLIDFPKVFDESVADKNLVTKLLEELPGILNWSIEGCLMWQKDGLSIPESVRTATEQYQIDSNPLFSMIEKYCIIDRENPDLVLNSSDIYQVYVSHCNEQNLKPNERISRGRFLAKFDDIYRHSTTGGGKTYFGIALNESGLSLLKQENKTKTIIIKRN